jgi:acetylornithine aminotransferase/acetylornithine/N-succinyldiaminopimelate aminotransferase
MTIEEIKKLDSKYYMNTFGDRGDAYFTHGKGTKLYGCDGREYTDFFGGIAVNSLGYGYPSYIEAVKAQLDKLIHCSNYYYNEPQALLAERLANASCADRVFFANSGGEANEGAVKLVRKYFKDRNKNRFEVISLKNSFHGRTLAMVAATGQEKYQKPYEPLPAGFVNIQACDIDFLESSITNHTAAVLLETIQGEGGIIELPAEYIRQVADLCRINGLLLILDEVQTGMGRTGKLFSYEHFGIEPDIFTCAKALGGGIPIGAVLAKEEAAAAFTPGDHGSTFGGNPLACAAGIAVMDAMQKDGLIEKCATAGSYFKSKLMELKAAHACIADVRGRGLMLGVELVSELHAKDVVRQVLHAGYVVNAAGCNTLRLVPPFIISNAEIDGLCQALDNILSEV